MSKSSSPFMVFDSEIEKTAKRMRKEAREMKLAGARPADGERSSIPIAQLSELGSPGPREEPKEEPEVEIVEEKEVEGRNESESDADSEDEIAMIDPDPRLCDLTRHDSKDPDSPIKLPEGTPPIEIKLALLGVLPKFYGKVGEDPYNFLNEFIRLCGIQKRPNGVSEEVFRIAVFSFTLSGEANAWFRRFPLGSVTTWTELKTTFLEYYFPSTKTTALKKEISSFDKSWTNR